MREFGGIDMQYDDIELAFRQRADVAHVVSHYIWCSIERNRNIDLGDHCTFQLQFRRQEVCRRSDANAAAEQSQYCDPAPRYRLDLPGFADRSTQPICHVARGKRLEYFGKSHAPAVRKTTRESRAEHNGSPGDRLDPGPTSRR